mmetsp:Transcript_35059/g.74557  ORF Transcript_35059/g.74557 Transcript_35059/m.74557 type:complete len:525 (-) Transcript_35059:52-1626(-)
MLTLERLLQQTAKQRGAITKAGAASASATLADYQACWDAFNRYISATLGKHLTLAFANFCKVGWRINESKQGKVKLRPHFQVTESWAQAYNLDIKGLPIASNRALTAVEEFNFSKAAIRFSQNLTKEVLFLGLRAIVQVLGDALASGQAVSINFEVGRLRGADKAVFFEFSPEIYVAAGLEVPKKSEEIASTDYRPSATFASPSPSDVQQLKLTGRHGGLGGVARAHAAALGGGWDDSTVQAPYSARSDDTRYSGAGSAASTATSRCDIVANDHLHRHLSKIEEEAAQAVAEKQLWEEHLKRLKDEAAEDTELKKAMARTYASQLEHQIAEAERRRKELRQHVIDQASQHDFPNFTESPDQPVYDYISERRRNLKEDLDEQVEVKNKLKSSEKQRNRQMETAQLEACQREMAQMRLEAQVKKDMERAVLHQSWEKDRRLHSMKKAIDEHHRTPASKTALSSAGPATPRVDLGASSALTTPRRGAVGTDLLEAASRPMTGSVRRVPLGAAASLALQRERLATARA